MVEKPDRVVDAGNKHESLDLAEISSRVWDSIAAEIFKPQPSITRKEVSAAKEKENQWSPKDSNSASKSSDYIQNKAAVTVSSSEFVRNNPGLKDKPASEWDKSGTYKVRHATTSEVDGGWKIKGVSSDGSIELQKSYQLEVAKKKDHDGLLESIPGVPDKHIKALEAKLAELPDNVKDALKSAGYKIVATRFNTDAIPELKGLHPRGWDPSSDFNTSDGTHDSVRRLILAPYAFIPQNKVEDVSRPDVLVHQIGHALDHALGKLSNKPEFQEAFAKDMQKMAKKELDEREEAIFTYFSQHRGPVKGENPGSEECFASLFGLVLTGPENPGDRKAFESNFSNTIEVVKKQIKGLGKDSQK